AEGRHREFCVALAGAHRQQLGNRRRRHSPIFWPSGQRQQRRTKVEHLGRVTLGDQLPGAVLRNWVELAVAYELDELRQGGQEVRIAAADRNPFRRKGIAADLPAAVHLTEHVLVGYEYVVDVDRVEEFLAREFSQRFDLYAIAFHVEQEVGDAVVFRGVRIGPRQQCAPLRELCGRGPDLLAGDAPAAVDPDGLGREPGQIRSGARLGKQLTPDHFAAEGRRQEPLLLL